MNELQSIKRGRSPAPPPLERGGPARDNDLYRAQNAWFGLLRGVYASNRVILKELAVTEQQCGALLEVACHGGAEGLTIGGLAARLQVRHNTVVYVVNRLSARGLVERAASPRDRRKVYVHLTQQGQELMGRFVRADRQSLEALRGGLIRTLGMPAGLAA